MQARYPRERRGWQSRRHRGRRERESRRGNRDPQGRGGWCRAGANLVKTPRAVGRVGATICPTTRASNRIRRNHRGRRGCSRERSSKRPWADRPEVRRSSRGPPRKLERAAWPTPDATEKVNAELRQARMPRHGHAAKGSARDFRNARHGRISEDGHRT